MIEKQTGPHAVPHGGRLARLSIEYKLPLIIGALLLLVITVLAGASYREMRSTSIGVASERLTSLTQQFRANFEQSGTQLRALMAATAAKPALAEYASTRNAATRARALQELQYTGPQPEQVIGSELRDSAGRVLLSTAPSSVGLDTLRTNDVLPRTEPGDSAVIGGFHLLRDTLVYSVAMPVSGARDAYVVRWRRISISRRGREQITQLLGSNASVYFGVPGGRWTDLEKVVAEPRFDLKSSAPIQRYTREDGSPHLAAVSPVRGTPWVFAVDFPEADVLAAAKRFQRRVDVIATIVLAFGVLVGWLVSRRITRPLRELTAAADSISAGDYSRRVRIHRSDELGRLGFAFGVMSSEVRSLRENLEHKVEDRTRDLNATLEQLRDAQDALVRKEKLAMLGQLSSGVGHELRNPLGVMTNAVYYLKTVLATAPANVHEYLDILQQQVTLSEKIVSDLLDFARQKPPQRKPTSLVDVTKEQIARLGLTNGVRIETGMPPNLPPVLADPVQVGQIVLNLLTNAVQAVGKNGTVHIRADASGDRVHYEVEDSGPGIQPGNMDKIFEPLFTTKARGIGLGLAVSRTLARANSGDLTATNANEPGRGARFRLTLQSAS
jgi:signal transduction histidine kinase